MYLYILISYTYYLPGKKHVKVVLNLHNIKDVSQWIYNQIPLDA